MSLSQRMRRLLKGTGATYATVADAAGCSPAQIGHLTKGIRSNPTLDHLTGIADFFGVEVQWLATGKGKPPTAEQLRAVAARRKITRRGRPTSAEAA